MGTSVRNWQTDLPRRSMTAYRPLRNIPLRYPVVHKGKRRAFVRRFPYSLIYLVEDARIVVIACFHGKRNPRHWQRR